MRVKLIDVKRDVEEETFGTCELCMSTGTAEYETFMFRDQDTGEEFSVDAWFWSWGDLFNIHLENIPRFAAWIQEQDVDPIRFESDSYTWLQDLVIDFEEYLEELEDGE